jgi:heptosyltransferase II
MTRIVALSPNWLGDAVLALPAVADIRRAYPTAHLAIAARRSVAGLFHLVAGVDEIVTLHSSARWWQWSAFQDDVNALRSYELAVVFPNSFQSALLVKKAGVAERWGYRRDVRSPLLTRAVRRVRGTHQAEYYQRLTTELGIAAGPSAPAIDVADATRTAAHTLLAEHGRRAGGMLVVLAPGAAYGKAKQWTPAHAATLIARLVRERSAACVLVGSAADAGTGREITRALGALPPGAVIDLIGQTSLELLAGVLASADVCVCNDSGAMHLAAAVGAPIVATFGPTDETATSPVPRPGRRAQVLVNPVWCRPCMLRECPIDHRCMTGLTPDRVYDAVVQ